MPLIGCVMNIARAVFSGPVGCAGTPATRRRRSLPWPAQAWPKAISRSSGVMACGSATP